MDLNALTTLVVEKFKEAGGYSELSDQELYRSVYKYLDSIYRKFFSVAKKKLEEQERSGISISEADYKKEYEMVEDLVMIYANKIAAVIRSEV